MNTSRKFDVQIPQDELDALLRDWHQVNAQRAVASRDAIMARLASSRRPSVREGSLRTVFATVIAHRQFRAAASLAFLIAMVGLLVPMMYTPAVAAQQAVMLPDGGRLEARDGRGQLIGPCALKHTDVKVSVTGPFTRVTVHQEYHNPYDSKVEAVYTFPLSNRAAVDAMSMTIGDRVVQAEMKERQQARQMYESARNQGYVASLLEQERPNIFTQSVANIEPGVDIAIEIRYIEMLQSRDGEYSLAFPMVVAPRYIPGSPLQSRVFLPAQLQSRRGSILLGPASFERMKLDVTGRLGNGQASFNKQPLGPAPYLQRIIDAATPIDTPAPAYRASEDVQQLHRSNPSFDFDVIYAGGMREFGQIAGDGLGHINGRWFYFDPTLLHDLDADGQRAGTGYASDTTQVPDASRITPMPVRPPTRAGHDISLSVSIDTGGPAIVDYHSDLHEIVCTDGPRYRDLGNKINLALRDLHEIPNRDFVLSWKTTDDRIQESTFAYIDPKLVDNGGGFFTVILAPPARVDSDAATPRELIFVLDTSGSMQGLPLEKAKAVMSKSIDAMRPRDTFNLITFSGDTNILWEAPRQNTPGNRTEAQNFLASRTGGGGTEMMTAINAALAPSRQAAPRALSPEDLANLPADGRDVLVRAPFDAIEAEIRRNAVMQPTLKVRGDLRINLTSFQMPVEQQMMQSPDVLIRGKWSTLHGERTLEIATVAAAPKDEARPLRIVMFLTDGQVGNDDAIIQAVRDNAKTTRVFGFGIGDSPNRSLLDGMAQAGRGEVEYVNLQSNPDESVQRFVTRISTPVLTDIRLSFSDNLQVSDTIPPLDGPGVPDMFDVKPLIIHGRYLPLHQGGGRGEGGARETKGTLTIAGTTGAGPYTRTIDLDLSPKADDKNDRAVIATLWARAKVDEIQKHPDGATQQKVVALGEQFSIMTPYTSFIAVEKARLTIAGRSVLVPVPIELPEGETWEGNFGGERKFVMDSRHRMTSRPATGLNGSGLGGLAYDGERYNTSSDQKPGRIEFPWQRERGGAANEAGMNRPNPGLNVSLQGGDPGADGVWYGYAAAPAGQVTFENGSLTDVEMQLQAVENQMRGLIKSAGLASPDDMRYSPDHFKQSTFVSQHADSIVKLNMITTEYNLVSAKLEGLAEPTAEDFMEADRQPELQALMAEVERLKTEVRRSEDLRNANGPKLRELQDSLNAAEANADAARKAIIQRNLESQAKSLSQSLERFRSAVEKQEDELDRNNAVLKDKNAAMSEFESLQVMRDYLEEVRKAQLDGAPPPPKPKLAAVPDFSNAPGIDLIGALNASSATSQAAAVIDAKPTQATSAPVDPEEQKRIGEAERLNRLRRIIDQRLWRFVKELSAPPAEPSDAATQPTAEPQGTPIRVVLSVRDVNDASLAELRDAGLRIDDIARSQNVIAGSIAGDKLDELAMLECVRRIEPLTQ